MSIFASQTQATVAVPGEDGQTVTVRALTGGEYDAAQEAHLKAIAEGHSARGWSGTFRRQLAKGVVSDAAVVEMLADPLNGFDRHTVVKAGLVAWTYGEVTPALVDDLKDDVLEFIATEVMRLTKPSLFLRSVDEAEAATKKG